jgi:hypothetical protein
MHKPVQKDFDPMKWTKSRAIKIDYFFALAYP